VLIFCAVYVYTGKLAGVNGETVMLSNAKLVYETGALNAEEWKFAEDMPCKELFLQKGMIESFGELCKES
jgi:hypothetical protein